MPPQSHFNNFISTEMRPNQVGCTIDPPLDRRGRPPKSNQIYPSRRHSSTKSYQKRTHPIYVIPRDNIPLNLLTPLSIIDDTTSIPSTRCTPREVKRQKLPRMSGFKPAPRAGNSLFGKKMFKVYGTLAFSILLMLGVLALGKYHNDHPMSLTNTETVQDVHRTISESLIRSVNSENIKKNLRQLTKEPHLAGSDANKRVAYKIADMWNEAGLEDVHMIPYEVLLSYPDFDSPNRVFIHSSSGREIFSSKGVSPVIIPDEQGGKFSGAQWLAYAEAGRVTGDVVFCNRGHETDFENLKKMGIDVRGKIALLRYGSGFRGDKVHIAQQHGVIGAILYSDPGEVAQDGIDSDHVYPKTLWMPHEAVQRGSIKHGDGDPLTPLYPSKKELFARRTIEKAKADGALPSIPVLPVSYSTAWQILSRMKGRPVPLSWQGNINVTYRVGPGFERGDRLTIDVHSSLQTKKIRNVVGYIKGVDEPDRYVILGNHFDAWVYGSMDPNSGTAILAEVARAMVETVNTTGWRPARTIMFTSWDAEEYGLIGSTEFVEEFADILRQRAVVYLNMDCLQGNSSLSVNTIPSLYRITVDVAKRIKNPLKKERSKGRETLYDTWVKTFPSEVKGRPVMKVPSGGSDHAPFLNYVGVPVVDFNFRNASTDDGYPLYHTMYETPFLNEHLLDTDNFSIHRAVGQYWAELARVFTDDVVLPFNSTELAVSLIKEYLPELRKELAPLSYYTEAFAPVKQQMAYIAAVAQEFFQMAQKFEQTIQYTRNVFAQNPYDSRAVGAVNERLMNLARCFVNPRGIPGSPQSRHVLFSVSDKDSYASRVMAGVYDAIDSFNLADSKATRMQLGRELADQISIVQYSIHCAISTLREHI